MENNTPPIIPHRLSFGEVQTVLGNAWSGVEAKATELFGTKDLGNVELQHAAENIQDRGDISHLSPASIQAALLREISALAEKKLGDNSSKRKR